LIQNIHFFNLNIFLDKFKTGTKTGKMSSASSLNRSLGGSNEEINEFSANKSNGFLTQNQVKNLIEKTHYTKEEIITFHTSFLVRILN